MSLIDAECTVIDTPSDVRNYAQREFEKFHRKKWKGVSEATKSKRENMGIRKHVLNLEKQISFCM